jgi:hypothetical protein
MDTSAAFKTALDKFVVEAQALCDLDHDTRWPTLEREVLEVDPKGRRYVRIWKTRAVGGGRYAYCFVDTTNGDVLKPATWKAPAKGYRGNIYVGTAADSVTPYGARYLK